MALRTKFNMHSLVEALTVLFRSHLFVMGIERASGNQRGTERGARAGARDERGCTRPLRILSVVSVAASETAQAFERGRGQIAQA